MKIRISIDGKPASIIGTPSDISDSIDRMRAQGRKVERIAQSPREKSDFPQGYGSHSAFIRR